MAYKREGRTISIVCSFYCGSLNVKLTNAFFNTAWRYEYEPLATGVGEVKRC